MAFYKYNCFGQELMREHIGQILIYLWFFKRQSSGEDEGVMSSRADVLKY